MSQIVSLIGAGLSTVAFALLAYDLEGDNAGLLLGQLLFVKMLAYVLVPPMVAGFAGRLPRKGLLVALDLARAGCVGAIFFVTGVWQVFVLMFLLSAFSAGFKPVFQATIPELVTDDEAYTRALAYSRVAYDLEVILSPALAGICLLVVSFGELFLLNGLAFLISGVLLVSTKLSNSSYEAGTSYWDDVSFGVLAYLRTPRLRGILSLYVAIAGVSAMMIVNTVVYVKDQLGYSDEALAMTLAISGAGSMVAALSVPRLLNLISTRTVMVSGAVLGLLAMVGFCFAPDYTQLCLLWFVAGIGLSLAQTPGGTVIKRSSRVQDRPAYFSAQFSLSHLCWMFTYPLVGYAGAQLTLTGAAVCVVALGLIAVFGCLYSWPSVDPEVIRHAHDAIEHEHALELDRFHPELNIEGNRHVHGETVHEHEFVIDRHHPHWPSGSV